MRTGITCGRIARRYTCPVLAPVDSIARGQQIIEGLRNASSARVTVLRDGRPADITISLK